MYSTSTQQAGRAGPTWGRRDAPNSALTLLCGLVAACLLLLLLSYGGAERSGSRHASRAAAGSGDGGGGGDDPAAVERLLASWPPSKPKAALVVLARSSDLEGVRSSLGQLERRFNGRGDAQYPVIYLNDQPFTPEFRAGAAAVSAAPSFFGQVPPEHWSYPPHINQTLAAEARRAARGRMPYGGSEAYRFMCRYFSGFFFDHPLLAGFDYYWRVEPDVFFTCNLEADPFREVQAANQSLAWTIVMSEVPSTIPQLWPTVQRWLAANPHLLPADALLPAFLSSSGGGGDAPLLGDLAAGGGAAGRARKALRRGGGGGGGGALAQWAQQQSFSGCHFWSNFEIGALAFFRSPAYRSFFEHLDLSGGFFYERWGDAPVHTLAAAALLTPSQVRWASDIGYRHGSWSHCPLDPTARRRCDCSPEWDAVPGAQPSCQADYLARLAALEEQQREGQAVARFRAA